jgi:hypothetical protein
MRHYFFAVLPIMFCGVLLGEDASSTTSLPEAAQRAIKQSQSNQDKLTSDYKSKLIQEQKHLLATLDKISRNLGEHDDLNGAVAVKKEEDKIQSEINQENQVVVPFPSEMAGTWNIQYVGGNARTLSIDTTGNALVIRTSYEGTGWKYKITFDTRTNKFYGIVDPLGRVETYVMKDNKLSIEHWGHGEQYPTLPCEMPATGTKEPISGN